MGSSPASKVLDPQLYAKARARYAAMPHSAYKSGLVVQEYKRLGGRYSGRRSSKRGLSRWFKEEWRNQDGGVGYRSASDVYRPTKRVTSKTPTTFKELTTREVAAARRQKKATGHVTRFRAAGGAAQQGPSAAGKHSNTVINPVTGRWVLPHGRIGQRLRAAHAAFASPRSYDRAKEAWDAVAALPRSQRRVLAILLEQPWMRAMRVGGYPENLKETLPWLRRARTLAVPR